MLVKQRVLEPVLVVAKQVVIIRLNKIKFI